jgi:HK97 family phage portal protein
MPNPIWSVLTGEYLRARRIKPEPTTEPVEKKIYFYPDGIAPTTAIDQNINQAIRLGMLVHGPGASEAYQRAWHTDDSNSAVYACLRFISTAATEAPLRVFSEDRDGEKHPLADHPLQKLLKRPNPHLSMRSMEKYKQWCKLVSGNAYHRKVRAQIGQPAELWPISPTRIIPVTTKDDAARGVFISYYLYFYDPSKDPERIPVEDIIHYRNGLDDRDHRLGCSSLARVAREVMGDDAARDWQTEMLNNGGAAGMIVQVPADTDISREAAEELKAELTSRFGLGNRGKVGVLTGGASMSPYGFSPSDMDMSSSHRFPEERISAVFGAPAVIVGLGAGLEHSIYNNYHEAREAFTEDTLLPLYRDDADTLNLHLLPEFTSDPRITIEYDTNEMRALQEDADSRWSRVVEAWNGGLLTRNQAMGEMGLPLESGPEGDERKVPMLPPAGGPPGKLGEPGAKTLSLKAGEVTAETLQALVELSVPGFTDEFDKYLAGARRRVNRALTSSGD